MTTRFAVVNEATGLVCHFACADTFATRTEALLALLFWTPATPEFNVIAVDGDFAPPPHALTPRTPEMLS